VLRGGIRERQGGGPLESPAEEGGVGILPPRGAHATWSGSFGALSLCSEPPDADLSIVGVNVLKSRGVVENFEALIADSERGGARDLRFMSARGRAPTFEEPYADASSRKAPYTYHDLDEPVEVDGTCEDDDRRVDLVMTFDTDHRGGLVESWEILYVSDGDRYTTGPVPWEIWLCGDSLGPLQNCP
jgi:hypothetical protein